MKVIIADSGNVENIAKLHSADTKVVAYDFNSEKSLQRLGVDFKRASDFVPPEWHKNAGRYATSALREWGNIKIGGKCVKDCLTVENMPFWDVIESSLSTHFFESSRKLFDVDVLKAIVEKYAPETIVVTKGSRMEDVAKCVASTYKTNIESIGRVLNHMDFKLAIRDYFFRYANIIKERQRRLSQRSYHIPSSRKKKIVVFLTIETEFSIIFPVIEKLRDSYDLVIVRTGSIRERMKKMLERAKIESIPIECFLDSKTSGKISEMTKLLGRQWETVEKSPEFRSGAKYMGIDIWSLLKEDFDYYFSTRKRINEIIRNTEAFRSMIGAVKPDLVLGLDDISDIGKPISIILRNEKIPYVVLQHGLYGDWTQIYGPSAATINCVWGPYIKKMLSKNWYEPHSMVVTGCPKFDILAKTDYNVNSIISELGLDKNKKTILFISSVIKYIDSFAPLFLDSIKNIVKNEQIIIKLHPREYRENFYKNLGKKMGLDIKVLKNFDLYKLIKVSDVVVTLGSTVGAEALIMKKPVLVVNFIEQMLPYLDSYRKTDAFCAKTPDELKGLLREILYQKAKKSNKNSKETEKFVYEHVYKIDGHSADRVVNVVKNLIGEK